MVRSFWQWVVGNKRCEQESDAFVITMTSSANIGRVISMIIAAGGREREEVVAVITG